MTNNTTTISIKINTKQILTNVMLQVRLDNDGKTIDWDTFLFRIGEKLNVVGGTISLCQPITF